MNKDKLIRIMKNFEEEYLYKLLGDLKDSLIEWTDSQNILTKDKIIDIILAVNGLSLFNNEEFRYNFIVSVEDQKMLKHIAELCKYSYHESSDEQILLANKISKIQFDDNLLFQYIIKDYLGDSEFQFQKKTKESPTEIIERIGNKFYEL